MSEMRSNEPTEVLKGTLDLMILKALSWGPMHGYGVVQWLKQTTDAALQVEDGAMYPALHRLQRKGWIAAEWGVTENSRRAKYYELTAAGRAQLKRELAGWARFSDAVRKVVEATDAPG
jgi:PadR family transcriptional regulator, regulatory protein PadR